MSQLEGVDRLILLLLRHLSWKFKYHERLSNRTPEQIDFLERVTRWSYTRLLRFLRWLKPANYTDAYPYKILWVAPEKIKFISGLHDQKRRGWVLNGAWDQDGDRFMGKPVPAAIHDHFVEGVRWDETPLSDRYENRQRFQTRCEEIEDLYQRISTQGFRSQRNLIRTNPDAAWGGVNATLSPRTNEITVDIGRNGELLWNMLGRHRLAIAKVLNLDEVPVLVNTRHTQWQKIRDIIREDSDELDIDNKHPDLQDLVHD